MCGVSCLCHVCMVFSRIRVYICSVKGKKWWLGFIAQQGKAHTHTHEGQQQQQQTQTHSNNPSNHGSLGARPIKKIHTQPQDKQKRWTISKNKKYAFYAPVCLSVSHITHTQIIGTCTQQKGIIRSKISRPRGEIRRRRQTFPTLAAHICNMQMK